jgi:hypothetical protein
MTVPRPMDGNGTMAGALTGGGMPYAPPGMKAPPGAMFSSAPLNPTPTAASDTSDPFIMRDQMYGLNPTPVDAVSNALMRRYRSYYR